VANDVPQNTNGFKYDVPDLRPGTEYQFRIRAFIENEGWQNWSDALVSNAFQPRVRVHEAPLIGSHTIADCEVNVHDDFASVETRIDPAAQN